jgi:two-component system, OmpR family, KDP operon response regulator KdpE
MTTVLVIEDDAPLRRALRTSLRARGLDVVETANGEEALVVVADRRADVVLLDLGLPGLDGIEVLRRVRSFSDVPVVVLTARDRQADKIGALDAGADDYVTKPFGMGELLARLRAALRRAAPADEEAIVVTDDFTVDLAAKRVRNAAGDDVRLTPTEWAIVELLVRHPGKLIAQRQMLHEVWGPQYDTETNYLRVYLAQIRRKLEPDPARPRYFLPEPRMGYRFQP